MRGRVPSPRIITSQAWRMEGWLVTTFIFFRFPVTPPLPLRLPACHKRRGMSRGICILVSAEQFVDDLVLC